MDNSHLKNLINIYNIAPINKFYKPKMNLSLGKSKIEIEVKNNFFHTGGSVHGSIYFKILDDAAYFASQTHEKKYFLYTVNFQINFLKPIFQGKIISRGKLLKKDSNKFISKAKLFDNEGNEVANGEGIFVKSNIFLKNLNRINF